MTKLLFNKPHSETMKNEAKILELLADMARKQDRMVEDFRTMKKDLREVKEDLSNVKYDLSNVKEDLSNVKEDLSNVKEDLSKVKSEIVKINSELVKLNLLTSEHTRAILKLSNGMEQVVDHEKRISKLESISSNGH